MFGIRIISKKTYESMSEVMQKAETVFDNQHAEIKEKNAKIEELTFKLYLQTLELKEVNAEREQLIYNRRDNHGCLIRNKK